MEISEQGEAYSVGGSVSVKVILLGSSAWGFPGGTIVKNLPAHAGDPGSTSWRRKWQPTPVFLPGKSHGWRSLVGYSPWGPKEPDTTEHSHTSYSPMLASASAETTDCLYPTVILRLEDHFPTWDSLVGDVQKGRFTFWIIYNS